MTLIMDSLHIFEQHLLPTAIIKLGVENAIAAQYESARPWVDRRPLLSGLDDS